MTTLTSSQQDKFAFNPSPFPDLVETLAKHFASINVEAYLVGGVLRDSLLGSETKDIDIAVVGDAMHLGKELASSINGHFVELHPDFGISRVVVDTSNTQSYIDLNSIQGTINYDLARRDFTIDSFAIPLADAITNNPWESLIDPNDGLSDLQSGTVREVSSSVFSDDPARLMRAVRLTTQLSFDIENDTGGHRVDAVDLVLFIANLGLVVVVANTEGGQGTIGPGLVQLPYNVQTRSLGVEGIGVEGNG